MWQGTIRQHGSIELTCYPQIYSTYVLLTQIAGQQLHVEAGLLLCAAGQELIPLAGKHSLPPLIATSFWSFVAKLFIVHSF